MMNEDKSSFYNGNKQAKITRGLDGYLIDYYLDNKLVHRDAVASLNKAETLAESYVLGGNSGPSLIME